MVLVLNDLKLVGKFWEWSKDPLCVLFRSPGCTCLLYSLNHLSVLQTVLYVWILLYFLRSKVVFFVYDYSQINKIRILIILIDSHHMSSADYVLCFVACQSSPSRAACCCPVSSVPSPLEQEPVLFFLLVLVPGSEPRACACQTRTLPQSYTPRPAHF